MSFQRRGLLPLDYRPVVYPGSVLRFRGPAHGLVRPHVLCLGGSETFGRFIHTPFAAQLDAALPVDVVNMGVMNAGLDVLMTDPAIRAAQTGARAVVLQIPGAQNMSNRFYSVHPRRNDRFIRANTILHTIYREVDFTEFHFTRHLLSRLMGLSPDRFALVTHELRSAWVARMTAYLRDAPVPVHLLWLSRRHPDDPGSPQTLGPDPLFVTREMLDRVAAAAAALTIAAPEGGQVSTGTRGMFFAPREAAAARALPGPELHEEAARRLARLLS
jgi:hypothetical protein